VIQSLYIKIAVFSMLQLKNPAFNSISYTISTLLAAISFVGCIIYPYYLYSLVNHGVDGFVFSRKKNNLKDPEFIRKYGGIWDEYKEK
jgi:hypothetical protein